MHLEVPDEEVSVFADEDYSSDENAKDEEENEDSDSDEIGDIVEEAFDLAKNKCNTLAEQVQLFSQVQNIATTANSIT